MNNLFKRNSVANRLIKNRSPRKRLGFTLIEVMLAMAVFAIAGTALLSSADSSLRGQAHLEEKIIANWVASNQLVATSLDSSTWPPKNNKKGKVEMAGREWHWQQKVIKTTDNNLRAIVIEIRRDEKDESSVTSLMTYVSKANK